MRFYLFYFSFEKNEYSVDRFSFLGEKKGKKKSFAKKKKREAQVDYYISIHGYSNVARL
jgi:hypothetical protein